MSKAQYMKSNLKQIMQKKGVSIRGLSDLTENVAGKRVSTSTIQKIRKGLNCEFEPVRRIAEALGVEVQILFNEPKESKEKK